MLAVATFDATRSANRAARVAERSLLAGLRPLLLPSREGDLTERVDWQDGVVMAVPPGHAMVWDQDGAVLMAIALRNAGAGLARLHGWYVRVGVTYGREAPAVAELDEFHMLTRDIYVPTNDTGFWQGAIRSEDDPDHERVLRAVSDHEILTIDVLYGDQEEKRRFVTRFTLRPEERDLYVVSAGRMWVLD